MTAKRHTPTGSSAEQFLPSFTTSAEAADERREHREETLGSSFTDRVSVTEGTRPPSGLKPVIVPRKLQQAPSKLLYSPFPQEKKPLTERQKRMMWKKKR